MTSRIIYHDFRNASNTPFPTPTVVLTAPMLIKGRRLFKTAARVNASVNAACVFLCGACTALSLGILAMLFFGL